MKAFPRHLVWGIVAAVPLVFLAVFFAWPVLTMAARGFLPDGVVDLTGAGEIFTRSRTWRIIGLTLAQAGVGTAISLVLGIPGAYVLYRCHFPGVRFLRGLVTVPFVLPTVVVGLAFRALFVPGGPLDFLNIDGTFSAIVIALVFFNYAVVVRTVGGMWARLDPRAGEAARSLGASAWRAFRTVTLPSLMPAITSAGAV
ncbi:MAG TPA: ABC transporter permease subunit, partial [Actinomycetaceae bacterium]|nr:ABC transporter permease subunit [Actinomycetaceae bacterium]